MNELEPSQVLFTGYALTWWQFRCENYETPKTWMMLKQRLRYDYVPIYHSILCEELQFLQQGSKSVKSYYEKNANFNVTM